MSNFMTIFVVIALLVAVVLPPVAATQGFLAGSANVVSRDRIVDQLRLLLGHGQNRERLAAIEDLLRPMFMVLPKDSRGSLEHRVARYALHRHFLVEHGWHIGLSLELHQNHTSSPAEMLKSRMPFLILELLEEQMGSGRVGLDDLAVVVATIEDLVHSDAVDLLELAYKTHGLSTDEPVDAGQANLIIRTFTLYFLYPQEQLDAERQSYITELAMGTALQHYPGWNDKMLWIEDVKQGLEYKDRSSLRPFVAEAGQHQGFRSVARWATAISAGFGQFSDLECKEIKNSLLDLEDVEREDGRVGLAKFYAPFLAGGSYHFSESPEYLKHLGSLDEHNPRQPSVIVPNVLYAKSNCMASSGFHAVCCIDSCEVLMAGLEEQVSQPVASPVLVAAVVSAMPSDTVAAPRKLSVSLRSRLDEIAGRHGGSVPLHSRLFAQWMHYAFPNECPYPRSLLAAEAQLTAQERKSERTATTETATREEMQAAGDLRGGDEVAEASEGPVQLWSEDEELLSDLVVVPERGVLSSVLRLLAGATVLAASAVALKDVARQVGGELFEKGGKHASQPWLGRVSAATESRAHLV